MRALLCRSLTGPNDLAVEKIPTPAPGPDEVLVRVSVAALNFFDTLIVAGKYQVKPELPFSPGAECCGTIESVGDGVRDWHRGERVIAHLGYGTCREFAVAPVTALTRVPEGVSDEQAAGLTVTYGTSIHALKDRARLQAGETLAVLGAAGGVGLAAVEIGKAMGAKVIACASSPEKLALASERGADLTLDYKATNLKDGLRELTGGSGVDVIYDPVGADLAEPALRALAWQGRYLVIGFAGGTIPKMPLNLVLLKGCDIQGVFWGSFIQRNPQAHAENQAQLLAWVAEGRLSAHVHAVYPLEEAAAALGAIARREAQGKILLRP